MVSGLLAVFWAKASSSAGEGYRDPVDARSPLELPGCSCGAGRRSGGAEGMTLLAEQKVSCEEKFCRLWIHANMVLSMAAQSLHVPGSFCLS